MLDHCAKWVSFPEHSRSRLDRKKKACFVVLIVCIYSPNELHAHSRTCTAERLLKHLSPTLAHGTVVKLLRTRLFFLTLEKKNLFPVGSSLRLKISIFSFIRTFLKLCRNTWHSPLELCKKMVYTGHCDPPGGKFARG